MPFFQKFILTLASEISDELKALWILERNDNNKELQLEASSRVVHKRSTSQNMPIWEHKRSSSVISSYTPFHLQEEIKDVKQIDRNI